MKGNDTYYFPFLWPIKKRLDFDYKKRGKRGALAKIIFWLMDYNWSQTLRFRRFFILLGHKT